MSNYHLYEAPCEKRRPQKSTHSEEGVRWGREAVGLWHGQHRGRWEVSPTVAVSLPRPLFEHKGPSLDLHIGANCWLPTQLPPFLVGMFSPLDWNQPLPVLSGLEISWLLGESKMCLVSISWQVRNIRKVLQTGTSLWPLLQSQLLVSGNWMQRE